MVLEERARYGNKVVRHAVRTRLGAILITRSVHNHPLAVHYRGRDDKSMKQRQGTYANDATTLQSCSMAIEQLEGSRRERPCHVHGVSTARVGLARGVITKR